MRSSFRLLIPLLLGCLLVSGCRTYGNEGYDSGPKTYRAIQNIVQQIEQEKGRAQSELRRLEAAAEKMEALRPLAERYRTLVDSHEALLKEHRHQAEELTRFSAYRTLHREYGAMVTDRRLLQRQYERTVRKVWATVRDTTIPRTPLRLESSYTITPVNFPKVGEQQRMSMATALQEAEGAPGLQREEQGE